MNFKTTYILFGLLGAMLAVLAIVLFNGPSAPPGAENLFPSMHAKGNPLKADDVDKVVIQRKKAGEPDVVFERADAKTWKITSPRPTPADSNRVSTLIDNLLSARVDDKEKAPSASRAGLDEPSRVITVQAGERSWTLTVGESTPGDESALVYVLSSDRPGQPLAVRKRALESALEGFNYFRSKELFGDGTSDLRSVTLTRGKSAPVELKKDKERWLMVRPPYGDVDAASLLGGLGELRVDYKDDKTSDFVKDAVTDLAAYHLDPKKADVLRIDVTRDAGGKGVTQSVLVGVSKKVAERFYHATVDDGGKSWDVVKVAASAVEPILKWIDAPQSFRSKNLLALESFRQPDAIDVENSFGKLEFRHPDQAKPWELYRGTTGNPVDEAESRKLIDELNKKDVVASFPEAGRRKELGLEKPDVVVRVYADSLEKVDAKKPGKPALRKDAKPVTELRFGRPEGANVAVERVWGDQTALVMVPMSVLDQVRKGPLSYLDRSLPSFNPGSAEEDVTRVELARDGQKYALARASATAPWLIEQPATLKGRTASADTVREILGELNRLSAREVVAEKADAAQLAGFGLASPPVRVTITQTKDAKPTTTTFDFGSEVAGKGVYLKRSGKDAIYLVGGDALVPLRKELRDTAVFDFEPDRVASLTVRGWSKLLGGSTAARAFELKDGKWTTKEAGYNLDPAKVEDFVRGLSRLHLEKFVPAGKGLALNEDALQVEVTLTDRKVLVLTVGAAEGESYYATSSRLKGDTFLVPKAPFEKVRATPGSFAK